MFRKNDIDLQLHFFLSNSFCCLSRLKHVDFLFNLSLLLSFILSFFLR